MLRYLLELGYNGKNYHGWQMQVNAHTVQAEITDKISILLKHNVNITGCGRTDTGVHARRFYAHFDLDTEINSVQDFIYKLNSFLPSDIVIYNIIKVDPSFNARFTAINRTYRYFISKAKNPFMQDISYYLNVNLDIANMSKACDYLIGSKDFTSFSKLHTQTATNNCNITSALWKEGSDMFVFEIKADRFLRNMVRAIVGTLLEIGKGKLSPEAMKEIIMAKDRSKAGFSVPAHGLFLEEVIYPKKYNL